MQNYLTQYINESQIQYASIFPYPINVLKHLLFTNGNGVDFVDGNPVEYLPFQKLIPFKDYYKDTKSFEENLEYFKEYHSEAQINENYNRKKSFNDRFESLGKNNEKIKSMVKIEDELWKESVKEFHDDLRNIKPLELTKINDLDYWVNQLLDSKYLPLCYISDGYYDLRYFNENTDKILIEYSLMVIKSYLTVYEMFNDDMFVKYEYPMGNAFDTSCLNYKNEINIIVGNDIKILEKELIRFEK